MATTDPARSETLVSRSELGSWRLWRHLCLLQVAADAAASLEIPTGEMQGAWEDFCGKHGVDVTTGKPVPKEFSGCDPDALKDAVIREVRIARWKKAHFGKHAREHFDKRKPELDRVVYSLLRVGDAGLARELWFRLAENEAAFADLAPRYTAGHEVHTNGLVGPATFGSMHPALAAHLRAGAEGQLLKPLRIAEIFVVARVEKFLPAQFDDDMEARMIEELAAQWLNTRLDEAAR